MKKNYRCLFLCATLFSLLPNATAQDSTKNNEDDQSYFEAGLSYLSNNVYLGRHDSLKIPYLAPSFNYYNKSGFYAGTSLSYLNSAANSRIDLVEIEAGYAFTKDKFSGILSIEKDFYNSQKPVAMVCHAPASLKNVKALNGEPLVKGKKVTGFTNEEEAAVQLTKVVPFLVEDMLKENGAHYEKKGAFKPFVIEDGLLITGQNPASSEPAAQKLLALLEA